MDTYWELIGADVVAEDILSYLTSTSANPVILKGKPGVGKSWLSKYIGVEWESAGGKLFYCEGSKGESHLPYYAMETGVISADSILNFRKQLPSILGKSIDTLFGTRGVFESLVDSGIRASRQSIATICPPYDEKSTNIVTSLEYKSASNPILIIADNLHWWDKSSLSFLSRITGKILEASENGTPPRVKFLLVYTDNTYQVPINKPQFEQVLSEADETFTMPSLNTVNYKEALRSLGLRTNDISKKDIDTVRTICGDHLPTICTAIEILNESGSFFEIDDRNNVYEKLIDIRSKSAKKSSSEVIETLQCASILGLKFMKSELLCLRNGDVKSTSHDLHFARNLGFIEESDNVVKFTHEAFKSYFSELDVNTSESLYTQLNECLVTLRPGDYLSRSVSFYHSNFHRKAADYLAAYIGRKALSGQIINASDLKSSVDGLMYQGERPMLLLERYKLREYVRSAIKFWMLLRANKLDESLLELRKINHSGSVILEAEKNLYWASYCSSSRSSKLRESLIIASEKWGEYREAEADVWTRLMLQKIHALSLSGYIEKAREIALDVEQSLISRKDIDPYAEEDICVLSRISPSYYPNEIAIWKMEDSRTVYRNIILNKFCRRPDEYFRLLNNLGALYCLSQRWGEAQEVLKEAVALYKENLKGRVSNYIFTYSNYFFSLIRAEKSSYSSVASLINNQLGNDFNGRDIIFLTNVAGFNILGNNLSRASELLAEVERIIERDKVDEEFASYHAKSMRVICDFHLNKNPGLSKRQWKSLNDLAEQIPYSSVDNYISRHSSLVAAFDEITPGDIIGFDRYLLDSSYQSDSIDEYYKQGVLISVILYWRAL